MRADPADMPPRISALPRDRRGLPIPVTVLRDDQGLPHFTINDSRMAARCYREGRCGICGETLGALKCFVGGPGSAFHPAGLYFDGPMHRDCAAYALGVCPYLAVAGGYTKSVGARTLRPGSLGGRTLLTVDPTIHPDQPAVFVLGSCRRFSLTASGRFKPERPWAELRYFRAGQEIGKLEAQALAKADPTAAAPFTDLEWP
jgi:hypothetical protein